MLMLPTSLPGGKPSGIVCARPKTPRDASRSMFGVGARGGEPVLVGGGRVFGRRPAAVFFQRPVRHAVALENDVLHDAASRSKSSFSSFISAAMRIGFSASRVPVSG